MTSKSSWLSQGWPSQRKQLDLLKALNARHQKKRQPDARLEARIQSFELAYRMQMEATDAFDVSKEPTKIRDLYQQGRDDEALAEIRKLLNMEPTTADAFLLSGRINQRRGDQEAAIAALKTAIFWDSRLIDAHILLGRIFLERGDIAEAKKYAASAIAIDPDNQEAMALQRQVTMGGKP